MFKYDLKGFLKVFEIAEQGARNTKSFRDLKSLMKATLENIEVLKEEVVTINPLDSLNALDNVKGGEYKPYLKNMLDFTIMDLDPKIGITMYGVLYIDLAIYNKYEDDTQASMSNRVTYANDDMGIITATGDKDKNKGYGQSNSNRNTQNTY